MGFMDFFAGGGKSAQAPGSPGSGLVEYDFYDNFEEMHNAWLNDIDDFVSPDEQSVIKSPYATYGGAKQITGMTSANPCKVSITDHGFSTGDRVLIVGVIGMSNIKGQRKDTDPDFAGKIRWTINGKVYTVTENDSYTFTLDGVNAASFTNGYTSGGWALKETAITTDDGSADVTIAQTEVTAIKTAIGTIDVYGASGDYNSAVTRAVAEFDNFVSDDDIDDAVTAFEQRLEPKFARAAARFAGGMTDINAVNSSGFMIGLALIESEKRREVFNYHKSLSKELMLKKPELVGRGVELMMQLTQTKLAALQTFAHLQLELKRIKISLDLDKGEKDRAYTRKNLLWPLDRYAYGFNAVASLMGAVQGTAGEEDATATNAIGGAAGGMAMGAQIGATVGGPAGALVGAGVGAIAGLLSD